MPTAKKTDQYNYDQDPECTFPGCRMRKNFALASQRGETGWYLPAPILTDTECEASDNLPVHDHSTNQASR